jgi:thioredoxin 1
MKKKSSSRAADNPVQGKFLLLGLFVLGFFAWAGLKAVGSSRVEEIQPNAIYNNIRTGQTVVMFSAEWCGWCRKLEPGLDRASRERPEVRFLKVEANVPRAAQRFWEDFSVNGYPTLVVYRDGIETGRQVGYVPDGALHAFLTRSLSVGLAQGGRTR